MGLARNGGSVCRGEAPEGLAAVSVDDQLIADVVNGSIPNGPLVPTY